MTCAYMNLGVLFVSLLINEIIVVENFKNKVENN